MIRRFALAAAVLAGVAVVAPAQRSGFPHSRHEKLFLTCAGCHAGIQTSSASKAFPAPSTCAACHDGKTLDAVVWSAPARRPTNLVFSHADHLVKSSEAGTPADCVSCHAASSDTAWMHVRGATAAGCVTCHTNATSEHLAVSANCRTCHRTLAESRELTPAMIDAFPKPPSHRVAGFASNHAPTSDASLAQCATCHAQQSCVRCHANAASVPAIARLRPDARVAELMRGRAALYPTPASHDKADWAGSHAKAATRSIASCANCHTQPSCRTCHVGDRAPKVIAELPEPVPGGAPGVALTQVTMHEANFLDHHKSGAASGRFNCTSCHEQRECTSCHEGASSRRYHPNDFVYRHPSEAFSQEQTCASCHRTETFCRNCHQQSGFATSGAKTGAVHTGQPVWLLQHGEAARRGLTECTTCHQQRDCLRCHSSQGLKVNPHGPDFDAKAMSARAKQMCATCHVKDPTK